jgi:hypothetical protein
MVAAALGGDFAFTFDVSSFEMCLEIDPKMGGVRGFAPIKYCIFKLASLLDAVERFAHDGGFRDGVVAGGSKTTTFLDSNPKVFNGDLGGVPFSSKFLLICVELAWSNASVRVLEVLQKGAARGTGKATGVMFELIEEDWVDGGVMSCVLVPVRWLGRYSI